MLSGFLGGGVLNKTNVLTLVLVVLKLREYASVIKQTRMEWNLNKVTGKS